MAHLLAGLSARHEVAVLYLRAPGEPQIDDDLRRGCWKVEEVIRPLRSTSAMRAIFTGLRGLPQWAAEWSVPGYAQRLRTFVRFWQPQLIHIDYNIMGQYLPALDGCPVPRVLIQYDPGTPAALGLWRSGLAPGRVIPLLDILAWYRFERSIMRKVDRVVALTERDRRALAPLAGSTPIVTIPLSLSIPREPLDAAGRTPPSLLFVGNFVHTPNLDAAMRLVKNIFPHVKQQYPMLELHIVGDGAPPELQRMAGDGVVVTGRVPEVTPYLSDAAIVAAPLRMGGGMRLKVLEAVAAGKAVVASRLALEGLDVEDGKQVLLAESDEEFCGAIARLLAQPQERIALARRAREWACTHLGLEKSVVAFEQVYDELLGAAGESRHHVQAGPSG